MLRRYRRLLATTAAVAGVAVPLTVPTIASACEAIVSHTAAVYEHDNGTGFIKNKFEGERVAGPTVGFAEWESPIHPWVKVNVSGGSFGWMDFNELQAFNTCSL
jgi:hypothetical protein